MNLKRLAFSIKSGAAAKELGAEIISDNDTLKVSTVQHDTQCKDVHNS